VIFARRGDIMPRIVLKRIGPKGKIRGLGLTRMDKHIQEQGCSPHIRCLGLGGLSPPVNTLKQRVISLQIARLGRKIIKNSGTPPN